MKSLCLTMIYLSRRYIIPVSDTQAYKQFGNSVAVSVINAIAKEIIRVLDNN